MQTSVFEPGSGCLGHFLTSNKAILYERSKYSNCTVNAESRHVFYYLDVKNATQVLHAVKTMPNLIFKFNIQSVGKSHFFLIEETQSTACPFYTYEK